MQADRFLELVQQGVVQLGDFQLDTTGMFTVRASWRWDGGDQPHATLGGSGSTWRAVLNGALWRPGIASGEGVCACAHLHEWDAVGHHRIRGNKHAYTHAYLHVYVHVHIYVPACMHTQHPHIHVDTCHGRKLVGIGAGGPGPGQEAASG